MNVRRNIRNLIAHVVDEDYDGASKEFNKIFNHKAATRLEQVRRDVAKKKFAATESA